MLISQIGYYSLVLGLIFSVLIIPVSIKNLNNDIKFDSRIFSISFLQFIFVLISFLSLIFSFIYSDFSNETVYNNSHTSKPLFYKISGTWGNHEGSLLLWLLVLTLFIFLFLIQSKNQPKKYKILTLLFQQIIIIGFFLFVIKTSNPFNYLFPIPAEGLGLNPILQDPALAIHPPILYLGYVGSSIIFSSSLAAILANYINQSWAKSIKFWILVSWIFLTFGIMLGSIWAYYELGWGGFWFWDPVENISLMPWLSLTALLHCILVLEKKFSLGSWTIILSISTFILSMSGTFLVRSGILNSVHTFANDPERGLFILFFLFGLIFLSLIIFFGFYKEKQIPNQKIFLFSKETSILVNNWFIMYFLSVILIGTVYPIFLDILSNDKISVGPPFYNKLILPFLILFLFFMTIGPSLNWIRSDFKKIKNKLLIYFIFSFLICLLIFYNISSLNLISSILLLSAAYLFYFTIIDFFKNKFTNISQSISHLGFSLLVISILLNSIFSNEVSMNLKLGEKFKFQNGVIFFESLKKKQGSNYESLIGTFRIKDNKNKITILNPEIRIYDQPETITSEADIKTNLYSDKFIVMNLVSKDEYFNVRYQIKSFMIWIWISGILIAIGGMSTFYRRSYEK